MAGIVHELENEALYDSVKKDVSLLANELVEKAYLKKGNIVVVGCSTSEVVGSRIGSYSTPSIGKAIYEGLMDVFKPLGIYIAAQCCEHLNRAIIIENDALSNPEIVNVIPKPKAGGSFASYCYQEFNHPIAIESIKADAGIDIGDTLIGMHLKNVAVPLRLSINKIGEAHTVCAKTRPKFIGGCRAIYDEELNESYK